ATVFEIASRKPALFLSVFSVHSCSSVLFARRGGDRLEKIGRTKPNSGVCCALAENCAAAKANLALETCDAAFSRRNSRSARVFHYARAVDGEARARSCRTKPPSGKDMGEPPRPQFPRARRPRREQRKLSPKPTMP